MGAAVVVAEGLSKSYRVAQKEPGLMGTLRHLVRRKMREIHAVKDVSFTVNAGELVGFLGPNGAGKTTTLKMLTGLLHPTRGRATVDGFVPFARERSFLERVTLVMGNKQQLLWDLPTLDTLRVNAAIYGIDDDTLRARTAKLAEMLGLEDKLTQPVRKLSLGERMKAELMTSLLHEPRVLFLDEPTLGLDVNAQVAVRTFLKRYVEDTGATVLLTSHYMQDITALCARVLVIHEGTLVHDGSLDALTQKFAPRRDIRVELSRDVERADLDALGDVTSVEGRVVRFAAAPHELTHVVARLLQQLPVVDFSVQDAPIEEVMGKLFTAPVKPADDATGAVVEVHT